MTAPLKKEHKIRHSERSEESLKYFAIAQHDEATLTMNQGRKFSFQTISSVQSFIGDFNDGIEIDFLRMEFFYEVFYCFQSPSCRK